MRILCCFVFIATCLVGFNHRTRAHGASRRLLTLGIRFGEAESPGPGGSLKDHYANYVYPRDPNLNWEPDCTIATCSERVLAYLYNSTQTLLPQKRGHMICDSGASLFFSGLIKEIDRKVASKATWNSASSASLKVDCEGRLRLWVPDHSSKLAMFHHYKCFGCEVMGELELAGVDQLNWSGIGFTSPPWSWGANPCLFRGDCPSNVWLFHKL